MMFWLKTLRDSNVRAAKDRDKRFQSRLAASFSVIDYYQVFFDSRFHLKFT